MNEGLILFLLIFISIGAFTLFRGVQILKNPLKYNSFASHTLKLFKSPRSTREMKLIGFFFILFGLFFIVTSFRMFLGMLGLNEPIKTLPLFENGISVAANVLFLGYISIFLLIFVKDWRSKNK